MSRLPQVARLTVWGAALVLLTGPLGSGGRDADVLMVHQAAIAAMTLLLAWSSPRSTILTGPYVWILAALVGHGILVTEYKYAAGLALMDWISAVLMFGIVVGSGEAKAVAPILGAVVGAAALNMLACLVRWCLGLGFSGLFVNLHHGATLMAVAASMLVVSAVFARGHNRLTRGLLAVSFALSIVALGSRGGLLALVTGCGIGLVLAGRARAVLILTGLLVLTLVIPNPLSRRIWSGARGDVYAFERIGIWLCSARVARHEFLLGGAGLGQFEPVARRFNFPVEGALARYGKTPNHAHNAILQLIAEAGVGGILAVLAPLAWVVTRLRVLLGSSDPSARYGRMAVAGLTAVGVHSMVDLVLESPGVLYVTAGLFGVLAARLGGARDEPAEVVREERVIATVALVATFVAWALLPWLGDREVRGFRVGGDRGPLLRALRWAPGHAGYHRALGVELGTEYLAAAEPLILAEALKELGDAIRLAPKDSKLWALRARFQHGVFRDRLAAPEMADAALRDYEEASRREPHSPFLLVERASLLGSLGRYGEARRLAVQAVALESNYVAGWHMLARLCRLAGVGCDGQFETQLARLAEWAPRQSPGTDYERALLASDVGSQP